MWPLFDAAGPERETGFGNPYRPGEYKPRAKGAVDQIHRVAKLLGYEWAWSRPGNPEQWFIERKSETEGMITVNSLDAEIELRCPAVPDQNSVK